MVRDDSMLLPSVGLFTGVNLMAMTLSNYLQAEETAMVQEILDGNQLYIDSKQAKVNQKATEAQQVSTADSCG